MLFCLSSFLLQKFWNSTELLTVPLLCTKCLSLNSAHTHLSHVSRQQQISEFPNLSSQPRSSLSALYATQRNYLDTKAKSHFFTVIQRLTSDVTRLTEPKQSLMLFYLFLKFYLLSFLWFQKAQKEHCKMVFFFVNIQL